MVMRTHAELESERHFIDTVMSHESIIEDFMDSNERVREARSSLFALLLEEGIYDHKDIISALNRYENTPRFIEKLKNGVEYSRDILHTNTTVTLRRMLKQIEMYG